MLDSKKLKILITGASGFVGKNIVEILHKKYDFIAIVRESSSVDSIKNYCEIFKYDNFDNLAKFIESKNINGVLHLAASCILEYGRSEARTLLDSNIAFGVEILEALRESSNISFFINTLTFSMFANKKNYYPANLYAATKQSFYDITLAYSQEFCNAIFSHLLLYDTYGVNDTRNKIINLWAKNTKDSKTDSIKMSEGNQLIDLSYISDVVNAFDMLIDLCVNKKVSNNRIFTIENSKRYSLKELANIFENVSGKNLNIKWGAKKYRKNEIMCPISSSDNTLLLSKLPGFTHNISLESGFKMILDSINLNSKIIK